MINGIISETMNSRKILAALPPTYEEFVALALSSGVPADIIISEEGWRQLPTWLSKENLLSDITEVAVFGNASNRTVDAALKMLADVAYGRVATLKLTVLDTDGNPIPDVTVKLDATPTVGVDEITDENGQITISTDGGTHTANLIYPLGYSAEKGSITVEVSGTRVETVQTVSRSFGSYQMITTAKTFYIARYLSPVQFHVHGGGGSGCVNIQNSSGTAITYAKRIKAQGGAGGYYTITDAIDTAGKLIKVVPGSGGARASATTPSTSGGTAISNGKSGGTTTVFVGEDSFSANGGAGGSTTDNINSAGGAYGGAPQSAWYGKDDAEDGPNLFGDTSLARKGGGGGGAYANHGDDDEGDPSTDYPEGGYGQGGEGGGTNGGCHSGGTATTQDDASTSGGSGGCAVIGRTNGNVFKSGKGGDGFVAFRKAV